MSLKALGYQTKLYCTEADIPFLEKFGLLPYYDELDTTTLLDESYLDTIDGAKFWSIRKLLCIDHEMEIGEPFIYFDTDVIIRKPIEIGKNVDLMVWSPDPPGDIYVDWNWLSTPPNYNYPPWLLKVRQAYNAGILYFRNRDLWRAYFKQYLAWVRNNPGTWLRMVDADSAATLRNVWACNAEQRILHAVADRNKWKVQCFMNSVGEGVCADGVHFYIYRAMWREKQSDANVRAYYLQKLREWSAFLMSALDMGHYEVLTAVNPNFTHPETLTHYQ